MHIIGICLLGNSAMIGPNKLRDLAKILQNEYDVCRVSDANSSVCMTYSTPKTRQTPDFANNKVIAYMYS